MQYIFWSNQTSQSIIHKNSDRKDIEQKPDVSFIQWHVSIKNIEWLDVNEKKQTMH